MRAWKSIQGSILIQGKDFNGNDLAGFTFYLLSAEGTLQRTYQPNQNAAAEYLFEVSYEVRGDTLECLYAETESGETKLRITEELTGLTPYQEDGLEERLERALTLEEKKDQELKEQAKKSQGDRLISFEAALPALSAPAAFYFGYKEGDIVLWQEGQEAFWRDKTYGYHGKYLFAELEKILQKKYGALLRSFTAEVPSMKDSIQFYGD